MLLALIAAALFRHLARFPGLHGDEAWIGLRALAFDPNGAFSLHGMNNYTSALFSEIVAGSFGLVAPGVFGLRLVGAVFNLLAMVVVTSVLWKRGPAAFIALVLFSSSLLFLFYSRVAWEVTALQNLVLAVIFAAMARLVDQGRAGFGTVLVVYFAFALGVWNHIIFLAGAISLGLAAAFLVLDRPRRDTARLFLLAAFNLALQLVLALGLRLTPDGAFLTHALPTLLVGLALVLGAGLIFIRNEDALGTRVLAFLSERPERAAKLRTFFIKATFAALLLLLPLHLTSFFGAVSGYILMERVMGYVPNILEALWLHARFAVLLAAVAIFAYRQICRTTAHQKDGDLLRSLMLCWAVLFFPALALETVRLQSDRYFIIPQFLFFCALALSFERMPLRWRQSVVAVMALGFLYFQAVFWQEVERGENRPPLDYRYVFHTDTSRHFRKIDEVYRYVREHGYCRVESKFYFIEQPMNFLLRTGPSCQGSRVIHIDYCDRCRGPLPGYAFKP